MTSNDTSLLCRVAGAVFVLGLLLEGAAARAGEWFDLDDKALATFDFEGMTLATSAVEFEQQFPDAKRDREPVDEEIGLECYEVRDLKNADVARFYFCDGRLYQLEIGYNLARVEKLGGMQAVLQKLVDTWGPADHAGESRWTWQRPMYKRRADFYAWPERAQLTITDMAWMPVVAQRLKRQDEKQRPDLGF
ncbi:MAG: hypothetical protein WD063_14100 [Pirellulales bacterium]